MSGEIQPHTCNGHFLEPLPFYFEMLRSTGNKEVKHFHKEFSYSIGEKELLKNRHANILNLDNTSLFLSSNA